MIERHPTLTRDFKIHHIDAGITPNELKDMTTLTRRVLKEHNSDIDVMDYEELEFLEQRKYGR
jgi:sialic acid synthase SpsE